MIRLVGYIHHIVREYHFPGDFLTKKGLKGFKSPVVHIFKMEHFSTSTVLNEWGVSVNI